MITFNCVIFSIFIALTLGYLKVNHQIDLSWFYIAMITLFWEIPALIGCCLAGVIVVIAFPIMIAVIGLPFVAIGSLVWLIIICLRINNVR